MGPFLEGPEKFSQSRGKISNLLITGLFYSHILYINRDSILYNKFKANTLSVFNYLNYRLTKKGFFGPEKCPGLSRNGPHRPFEYGLGVGGRGKGSDNFRDKKETTIPAWQGLLKKEIVQWEPLGENQAVAFDSATIILIFDI